MLPAKAYYITAGTVKNTQLCLSPQIENRGRSVNESPSRTIKNIIWLSMRKFPLKKTNLSFVRMKDSYITLGKREISFKWYSQQWTAWGSIFFQCAFQGIRADFFFFLQCCRREYKLKQHYLEPNVSFSNSLSVKQRSAATRFHFLPKRALSHAQGWSHRTEYFNPIQLT